MRDIDLAFAQALEQLVGRQVDQLDFVCRLEERVGERLVDADAGNLADHVVQAFDVLHVERRVHVDSRGKQLVDVLPAFGMARSGDVGMGQFVDQEERRTALERGVEVELLDHRAVHVEHQWRQQLKALEQRGRFRAAVGFEQADDDIGATAAQRLRCGEHGEGLADTGRGAEENLQPPALRACGGRLHFGKQLVRVGTFAFHCAPSAWQRRVVYRVRPRLAVSARGRARGSVPAR